jgi:hypothetical protein
MWPIPHDSYPLVTPTSASVVARSSGRAVPSSPDSSKRPGAPVLFWRHTGSGAAILARRGRRAIGGHRSSDTVAGTRSAQRLHPRQVRHRSGVALPTSRHQIGVSLDRRCHPPKGRARCRRLSPRHHARASPSTKLLSGLIDCTLLCCT